MPAATSVFFGGGTPSLLPADRLLHVLDAIDRADGAEVTVECNPDSADAAKLEQYAAGGVNRISLGVQSMASHVLRALGRTHVPANVGRAVADAARRRYSRRSISTSSTARRARPSTTGPPPSTRRSRSVRITSVPTRSPSSRARRSAAASPRPSNRGPTTTTRPTKYELADARLEAAGYRWYEISNWAKPGEECRHNLLYWTGGEYAGDRLRGPRMPRRAAQLDRAYARALHRRAARRRVARGRRRGARARRACRGGRGAGLTHESRDRAAHREQPQRTRR